MTTPDKKMLLVLSALWGGSFVFIRVAAPVFGPVIMVEARVLLAGIALLLYARLAGVRLEIRRWWREYLILGAINSAIPFLLMSAAEVRITASMAVLLNATSPLFGALVAAAFLNDRLTIRKTAGIGVSFCGVLALIGWTNISHEPASIIAIVMCLGAPLSYGFAGAYVKSVMREAPAIGMAAGSQLGAAALIAPFALFSHFRGAVTAPAVISVLALAFVCTTVAYILYFKLIISAGPARALSVTFLTPIFGLVWGALFIGEPITLIKVLACGIIIAGTALLLGGASEHRHAGRAPAASTCEIVTE